MKYLSSLKNEDLAGKICLLRVDFNIQNVDLFKKKIHPRVLAVLPTIEFLIKNGAKIVILSHRGRPKIVQSSKLKIESYKQFSLKPFTEILSFLLKKPIYFIDLKDFSFINKTKEKIRNSAAGSVFLLENLRFWPGEEQNDVKFAKKLAFLGDFYVNDAFAVSHRKNASVAAITRFLPSCAGLLLEKEIKNLSFLIKNPKKPMVVILGGAKISDKIGVIKNLYKKTDYFLLGGGLANTIFAAQGIPIGDSLCEEKIDAGKIMRQFGKKIFLPADVAVEKRKILDIGPRTIEKYSKIIKNAKTVAWNGPMGYFENRRFAKGSEAIAKAIMANKKAFSIIGGGETISLMSNVKRKTPNVFLSTGGGAMLEYLSGKKLPGLEALK